METKLMIIETNKQDACIYCVIDIEISESVVWQVLERNKEYFNMIKTGLIGVSTLKFQLVDKSVLVHTFSQDGHRAACYHVNEDGLLQLHKTTPVTAICNKNGLKAVEYDENHQGVMIYRILDNSSLDPVGDGFYLHDAIDFVAGYPAWKSVG